MSGNLSIFRKQYSTILILMSYKWSFYYQTREQEVPRHYCWCCQTGAAVARCEKSRVILNVNKTKQVNLGFRRKMSNITFTKGRRSESRDI